MALMERKEEIKQRSGAAESGMKGQATWRFSSNFLKRKKSLKKAFERVALPELSNLYVAGYYLTKSEKQAEELLEETYRRAFRLFKTVTPDTNCRAWLLSILRDLFMTRHRTRKTEPESVDWESAEKSYESLANEGDKVAQFFSGLQSRDIDEALKALPEELRMAITLVDVEELSYQEAARVMECPIATIRSTMSRARRVFQVALKDYAEKRSPSGRYPLQLKQIPRG